MRIPDPPPTGRHFYSIQNNEDGTVDVYLNPDVPYTVSWERNGTPAKCSTYFLVVRRVEPWEGMEEDIRSRYDAWCESGEMIIP